ncbi:MAG: hypothetical protein IKW83_10135 [Muribaculaceae bacterium]|nr:hypothetical protein [Muribaculaceae bacterium]
MSFKLMKKEGKRREDSYFSVFTIFTTATVCSGGRDSNPQGFLHCVPTKYVLLYGTPLDI